MDPKLPQDQNNSPQSDFPQVPNSSQTAVNGSAPLVSSLQQSSEQAGQVHSDEKQKTDQIRKLGDRIEKTELPKELKENLIERISRLALLRASAGFMSANYIIEYENTAAYVNWVCGLPWYTKSQDILDLVHAKKILDKNHYGLESTKDRILEYLAEIILNTKNHGNQPIRSPILLFVGLAGTGKTTLGASVAESLGRNFERIPFGGMGDAKVLRGESRAFADAEPGSVIKKLVHSGTKNTVILLDELDRISEQARTDVMGVLIELLDPEQNKAFADHYIDFPFDLSSVLFIATANNTTNISTAVLDRLEVVQMPSYTDEEKAVIGKNYLFPKIRFQTGLISNQITINEDVWPNIIRPLGFDSGIRSLQRTIEGICRRVARQIVEKKAVQVAITSQNIKDFLPQY